MAARGLRAFLPTHRRLAGLGALCVALTLLSGVYFVRSLVKPDTGLVVNYPEAVVDGDRVVFSPKSPFSAAVASGLLPGRDQILAVNGLPIRSSRDLVAVDSRVRSFDPFPVEVLRDGTDRLTLLITPVFTPARPDWVFVLGFCIVLAATAFLLSLRQADAPGTVFLVLASLFYLVFTCVKPFYYESLLANCLVHLGKLAPWLLVVFGLFFPSPRGSSITRALVVAVLLVAYGVFFGLRIGLYARWAAEGAEVLLDRYRLLGQVGNAAEGASYLAWGGLMASAYLRAPTQKEKMQLRWIMAGILVALPPYFFLDQLPLILRHPGMRMSLGNLAQLFLSFIPVCTLIGLTRHRLFSLRFFLSRVVLSAAMLLAAAGLFSSLYLPIRNLLAAGYRLGQPAAELAAAVVLLAALAPVRWLLVRAVDLVARRPRGATRVDLERRYAELELLVEELGRQDARAVHGRRLSDLRAVLGGIVHALREPVRRIGTGLAAARDGLNDREAACDREAVEAAIAPAIEAGVRIGEVLRALESFGGSTLALAGTARADVLVRAAVEKTLQKHRGARIATDLACEGRIACFPEELLQALCGVLDNAVEAQEGRPAPVRVRLAGEQGRAVIEVDDSGPGLDPAARRRLFVQFHSTKPGHQGLGLYFARIVVERNDGSIDVGPGIDGGARARLVFPLGE